MTSVSSISSIKDLEQNPENFPLFMAQMTNKNISSLFSIADPLSINNQNNDSFNSILGTYGGSDDFFSLYSGMSSSDPLASLFNTQGLTSDFSFMTPSTSLDSYQVLETLEGLKDYTNVSESKSWLGQLVEYIDPVDNLLKTGAVEKVIIENVQKPLFVVNGTELELDDIKALNAELTASS